MIIDEQVTHADHGRIEPCLLGGLAQRGSAHVLMAVTSTAGQAPGVAVMTPGRTVLQQDPDDAGVVDRVQQQPGRAVPAPMPMTAGASPPAVAIPIHTSWVPRPGPTRRARGWCDSAQERTYE